MKTFFSKLSNEGLCFRNLPCRRSCVFPACAERRCMLCIQLPFCSAFVLSALNGVIAFAILPAGVTAPAYFSLIRFAKLTEVFRPDCRRNLSLLRKTAIIIPA